MPKLLEMEDYKFLFKVVLIGEAGVGKSLILFIETLYKSIVNVYVYL